MSGSLTGASRLLVPASLMLSFAANDGEELLTLAGPTPFGEVSQRHVEVGVAVIGALVAAATLDGIRTRGRGWFYQDVQRVFGLHGYVHLASAVLARGYVSGVVTSPTVVLPVWWWARRRLLGAGVPERSDLRRALPLAASAMALAHLTGAYAARARPEARGRALGLTR